VRTKQKSTDVNYLLTPDHWFWLVDDEDATRRPLISRKSHNKSRLAPVPQIYLLIYLVKN